MLGGAGLHAWQWITSAVKCNCSVINIEDNPVKMIFCCAVVQMQMIIFSSPDTVANTQILICKNEAINCNSMSDIHPLESILLSRI